MRRCVPVNVERQIVHVYRVQTRRFSSSPLSFGQELFQEFVRPLNKEQKKVITKKKLYYEPTLHKHVDGDLRVMLEVRRISYKDLKYQTHVLLAESSNTRDCGKETSVC